MPLTPSDPPDNTPDNMLDKTPDNKLIGAAIRFFWGALIGSFLALIPLSYTWYFLSDVTTTQIFAFVAFGALGGIIGMFTNLQQMGRFFDSLPWF